MRNHMLTKRKRTTKSNGITKRDKRKGKNESKTKPIGNGIRHRCYFFYLCRLLVKSIGIPWLYIGTFCFAWMASVEQKSKQKKMVRALWNGIPPPNCGKSQWCNIWHAKFTFAFISLPCAFFHRFRPLPPFVGFCPTCRRYFLSRRFFATRFPCAKKTKIDTSVKIAMVECCSSSEDSLSWLAIFDFAVIQFAIP